MAHSRSARKVLFVAAGCLVLVLAACDPAYVPSERDRALVTLLVGPDGDARLRGLLGGRGDAELSAAGADLATVAFPAARSTDVQIDTNDGGRSFLVVAADEVYEPGSSARFSVDVGRLAVGIRKQGFIRGTLSVCVPGVEVSVLGDVERELAGGCVTWPLDGVPRAESITVAMHPRPWRWFVSILMLLVAGAAAQASVRAIRADRWTRRRRLDAIVAGSVGCLIGLVGLTVAGSGPEMGVAGLLSGIPLAIATILPSLALPIALLSGVVVVVAIDRRTIARERLDPPQGSDG